MGKQDELIQYSTRVLIDDLILETENMVWNLEPLMWVPGILALELAGKTVFAGYQVVSRSQTFQDSGSSTRICSSAFMRYTPIRTAPKNRKAISHHILTLSVDISRTFPIFFSFSICAQDFWSRLAPQLLAAGIVQHLDSETLVQMESEKAKVQAPGRRLYPLSMGIIWVWLKAIHSQCFFLDINF